MTRPCRGRSSVGRWAGRTVVVLVGLAFLARAVVEVVMLDPSRPASYHDDWGGPSYLGVLLVHIAPGLLVLAGAVVLYRRSQQ